MRTQHGDRIIIQIVGHNPDGAINATMIQYVHGEAQIGEIEGWYKFRMTLGRAIRQWSRERTKE